MIRDQRGELLVEALVALPFLFGFAFAIAQLADGYAHQLLMRRAANAAVRAAVVVLPDDGRHYGDPRQRTVNQAVDARTQVIEDAARAVLRGSSSFSAPRVRLEGDPRRQITTTVEAAYSCPLFSMLCGGKRPLTLRAKATLPAQYAPYQHRGG